MVPELRASTGVLTLTIHAPGQTTAFVLRAGDCRRIGARCIGTPASGYMISAPVPGRHRAGCDRWIGVPDLRHSVTDSERTAPRG